MGKLDNKIALVTGGGRGIGEAISYALAKEGANVGINYVANEARAEQTCENIRKKYGVKAISIKADVASPKDVNNMMNVMLKEFSKIDILVNNAGTAFAKSLKDTSLEDWNKVMSIDLTGVFLCIKAVLPSMLKHKGGRIINITSSTTFMGKEMLSPYVAAKGGVTAFTKAIARELVRDNILVNCVAPGPTDTELVRTMPEEMREAVEGSLPLGRIASCEEVAATVVFLASSDGDIYVGQNLGPNCGDFML